MDWNKKWEKECEPWVSDRAEAIILSLYTCYTISTGKPKKSLCLEGVQLGQPGMNAALATNLLVLWWSVEPSVLSSDQTGRADREEKP